MGGVHSSEEVLGGIVDPRDDVGVTLSVCRPENDDVIQLVIRFEFSDVGSDSLKMRLLVLPTDQVVRSVRLIRSDKVGV